MVNPSTYKKVNGFARLPSDPGKFRPGDPPPPRPATDLPPAESKRTARWARVTYATAVHTTTVSSYLGSDG